MWDLRLIDGPPSPQSLINTHQLEASSKNA